MYGRVGRRRTGGGSVEDEWSTSARLAGWPTVIRSERNQLWSGVGSSNNLAVLVLVLVPYLKAR